MEPSRRSSCPMLAGERVLGHDHLENYEREDAFDEADVRLLDDASPRAWAWRWRTRACSTRRSACSRRPSSAPPSWRSSTACRKASPRSSTSRRSIDLVGDKIREIFGTKAMSIALLDKASGMLAMPYYLEHGERFPVEPFPRRRGLTGHVMRHRRLSSSARICWRARAAWRQARRRRVRSDVGKSYLGVPDPEGRRSARRDALYEPRGERLQRLRRAAPADARQRDERSAAERAPVRRDAAPPQGDRAARRRARDHQQRAGRRSPPSSTCRAIYDAVGDKIREIFNEADVGIRIYDPLTRLIHYPYVYESGQADRDRFADARRGRLHRARAAHRARRS